MKRKIVLLVIVAFISVFTVGCEIMAAGIEGYAAGYEGYTVVGTASSTEQCYDLCIATGWKNSKWYYDTGVCTCK